MRPAPIDPPEVHRSLWEGFSGEVGWDIGANCGQTLSEMTSRFTTVYAFEPAEECWPYLEQFDSVILQKIAVSDEDTEIQLVALPDKIDTGQLVTGNCVGMEWDPRDERAQARTLPARTVDSLVAEWHMWPDFMKIDVEGHEEKVLLGAAETLVKHRPDLLIEFHSPELYGFCMNLLEGLKYDATVVRHPHYPPNSGLWHQHGWIRAFS